MNVQILIDSIVRQTTVLIAELATSGGMRAPLAGIANQVFLELSQWVERVQGPFVLTTFVPGVLNVNGLAEAALADPGKCASATEASVIAQIQVVYAVGYQSGVTAIQGGRLLVPAGKALCFAASLGPQGSGASDKMSFSWSGFVPTNEAADACVSTVQAQRACIAAGRRVEPVR